MKNDKIDTEELMSNSNTAYSSSEVPNIQKDITLDNIIKQRLIIYGILSGISYAYMILVSFSGLGMPIFAITQLVLILYLVSGRSEVKNKKALLMFVPIFILTLSYFIRATYRFQMANFPVIFLLYSTMILLLMDDLSLENRGILFIKKIISTIFKPILHFNVPFKWSMEGKLNSPSKILMRKILIGLMISVPCLIIITALLMNADLVFENKIYLMFSSLENIIGPQAIFNTIIGVLAGFYLFGLFYIIFKKETSNKVLKNTNENLTFKLQADVIIISVLLISILAIYTMFAIIQFKYLFAGVSLPYDLTYAEYARKGFFELLFLSFINIGLILVMIYLLRDKIYGFNSHSSNSARFVKVLMLYLCAITVLLLASSFYRMTLYNNEYGFTELRLLVVTFLVFEAIGLLITFFYIIKPKFNIIAFYSIVCLLFYLTVNIVNLDYIIAKKNIDMHYEGKDLDVYYLYSLSSDAAPQMRRLLDDKDIFIQQMAKDYFKNIDFQASYSKDWRSFNLSRNNAMKIINELNLVFLRD